MRLSLHLHLLLIAIFVTCLSSSTCYAQADRSGELQQMVGDLAYQLKLVKQFDRQAAEAKSAQVRQAIAAWNQASRNNADFEVMEAWLVEAIRASLPGSNHPMPPTPLFAQPNRIAQLVEQPAEPEIPQDKPANSVESLPTPATNAVDETTHKAQVAQSETSVWKRHPAARPIDIVPSKELGDPFVDDPPGTEPRVVLRPVTRQVEDDDRESVRVNVAELGARVRGYVHGLRGVEARLVASPTMAADELLLVARELRQLATQREFLVLYLQTLDKEEAEQAPDLPTIKEAKGMIADRFADLKGTTGLFDEVFAEDSASVAEAIDALLNEL